MRIDLVINRTARMYQRDATLLDRVVERAGSRCQVAATSSLDELDEVIGQIARRGTDLLLLSGGDGSLMAGVSALWRTGGGELPPLSPIPGGTAGTIAGNWGIAGRPEHCLARLLERPRRIVRHASLSVRGAGELVKERIGFIFGTGLVARFFRLYYERGAPGYGGAARLAAQIFLESFMSGAMARRVLAPLPCSLEVDGTRAAPEAWSLVCCSVVRNLGLHLIVNYRAGEDPGRPHLVATARPPRALGPRAPLVLMGKPLGGRDDVDLLVRSFSVAFAERGPYVLDGELFEAARVTVRAGPELSIVVPA
jgi:diacylglycerol kinase family enzyme